MEISMFSHQMTRPQCPHRRRRLEKSFPLILGRLHSSRRRRRRRRRRKGDLEYLPSSKFAAVLTAGRIMSVCLPSKSQKSPKQPLRLLSCLFRLRPLQGCRYLISVHYLSRKYWGNLCRGKKKRGAVQTHQDWPMASNQKLKKHHKSENPPPHHQGWPG